MGAVHAGGRARKPGPVAACPTFGRADALRVDVDARGRAGPHRAPGAGGGIVTIDAMERIALALEIRTLRAELANGGVRTEDEKATVREAIEARRRRLAAVDIDRPSQAAPGRPARLPG